MECKFIVLLLFSIFVLESSSRSFPPTVPPLDLKSRFFCAVNQRNFDARFRRKRVRPALFTTRVGREREKKGNLICMKISTAALVKFPDTVYNPPPPPPPPLVPDRKQSFEFDSVLVTNGTLQRFS